MHGQGRLIWKMGRKYTFLEKMFSLGGNVLPTKDTIPGDWDSGRNFDLAKNWNCTWRTLSGNLIFWFGTIWQADDWAHGYAQGSTQVFPIPYPEYTFHEAKNSDTLHSLARICSRIYGVLHLRERHQLCANNCVTVQSLSEVLIEIHYSFENIMWILKI